MIAFQRSLTHSLDIHPPYDSITGYRTIKYQEGTDSFSASTSGTKKQESVLFDLLATYLLDTSSLLDMATAVTVAVAIAAFACLASLFILPSDYSLLLHFFNSLSSPNHYIRNSNNPPHPIANITNTLGPLLSTTARIHLPGSAGFNTSTDRWQEFAPPSFAAVVQVATEEDVQETIRWSNEASLPFLAISGGHGVVTSLGRFKDGVGIWMRELRDVQILESGGRAMIGGGALSGEVVHALWEEGKMTGEYLDGLARCWPRATLCISNALHFPRLDSRS
jgi:hypothetical protein